MAQHDMNIANQSFPSFRTDLNNALTAIQTTHSGTSLPTGAVAGQIWLDTTNATNPTLKFYDGADSISLATINYTANTVDWLDSSVTITGLSTSATGTVLTLSDTASTSTVNLIIDNQKEIRFRETTANGVNYVGLRAPASLTADLTYTLPSADGTAGQYLKTDGAGNLSFGGGIAGTATSNVMTFTDTANTTTQNLIIDNQKEVRWRETTANGVNYVGLKAPASLTVDTTFTLPSADGTSGQVLQTNGSGVLSFSSVADNFSTKLLHVQDEKSSGTAAGTSNGTSFNTRTLNTLKTNEISGASLASNQITLPTGTYFLVATAPSYNSAVNKLRLRNITDSSTALEGMSMTNVPGFENHAHNFMTGRFTIASSKTFEVQHWINDGKATDGLGRAVSQGTEVYTTVQIWKVS